MLSFKEKEEIQAFFKKEIYQIRFKIVHEGRILLKEEDLEKVTRLESMVKQTLKNCITKYG